MQNTDALVRTRRSVRTYENRPVDRQVLEQLLAFLPEIRNPYDLPVEFKLLGGTEPPLSCPVALGAKLFIGIKIQKSEFHNEAAGYSFERMVLCAQSLGLGTVWVGGTMDRPVFERAMELSEDEVMPCMSPLGYPSEKMSLREIMMRKGIKADERLPFDKLFFKDSFATPLTPETAGAVEGALEAVRLGPSAVNKQPWRVVLCGSTAHFYLKRSRGFNGGTLDMQKLDMGIALCHFDLTAREAGLSPVFLREDPKLPGAEGMEYIASYRF